MENIQRNLEKEVARVSSPRPPKKVKQWTLLLVGDHGEIISIRRGKSLAIWLGLVLFIGVVALVCLGLFYKSTLKENKRLKQALADSQQQVRTLRNKHDILMARLVIAESAVKATPTKMQGKQPVKKPPGKPKPERADTTPTATLSRKQPEKKSSPPVPASSVSAPKSPVVAVDNFTTTYEPDSKILTVQFKIVNTTLPAQPVSGHTFVILKPDNAKEEKWTVLPSVALIAGKPSLIKRGQAFLISRFRNVKFKVKDQTDSTRFKKATVMIYSPEGKLLLEKNFPLKIEKKKENNIK